MSNRTSYHLVAEKLREGILRGRFAAGRRLPSEHALCARYGVSRITIRHALQVLQEEAMVRKRRGSGNYVCLKPKRNLPILATDFTNSVLRHAPKMARRLLFRKWTRVNRKLAETTGLAEGEEVLHASRLDVLDGVPVAVDEVFLLAEFAGGVRDPDLASLNFLKRWVRSCRMDKRWQEANLEAVGAAPAAARLLKVGAGVPLLKEVDAFYVASERLVAHVVTHYRPDYVRMTLRMNWV